VIVLSGDSVSIRDQPCDGDDDGEGLDLGGHAVRVVSGSRLAMSQRRDRTWSLPTLNRRSSSGRHDSVPKQLSKGKGIAEAIPFPCWLYYVL
jgi:hypothetical protein